jgi:hypothetical protein
MRWKLRWSVIITDRGTSGIITFLRISNLASSIQPGKDQAIHGAEVLPLGQTPALYVNLMPKD